ncbi:tryptophan-rich sensory protein [Enterococcus mundtii]|uniref:Sensory protein n=1 Tax=Enterococcus mundtii TaxID=53346 RepID=A0A1L8US21_ENTMU|nr:MULTISPECIES: TspO/MBR family protein [Enterococcus]MZU11400.1 tryptophan-rich sensory protein [Bifidobacterium longum]GEN18530.1 sensory protein [Ligilactobacillus acidipiscis]AUB54478.1 tryptophan-rich sensory protein [Enterococcus mundtii]MZZ60013.1 tryptophan-rich sensory protein [Enterococcus mundtii]MZZ63017.1 tryptophan-rich sensory protein [Enterococcus mundtii]
MNYLKDYRLWLCLVGIVGLGFLSSIFSGNPGDYYYSLQLPPFAPPSWIFGPMWTLLYIMMGGALYLIINLPSTKMKGKLLILFTIQFVCNFLWTILFFNLKNSFIAAIDISLLLIFLTILLYQLWVNRRNAVLLMIPYYLWVIFATILNYSIYFLN